MLSLVRPKYFVPVHGEYRHLAAHAKLAWDLKVGESGIFVLVDGDVLELSEKGGEVVETVSAGPIYIDGLTTHDTSSEVLRDRRALSRDGVVTVVLSVDTATGLLTSGPKIVASGFMEQAQVIQTFDALGAEIERVISEKPEILDDQESVKSQIRDLTRKFLYSETHRRPMVIPVVLEI